MDIDPLPASPTHTLFILLAQAIEFNAPENWVTWSCIVAIACCCLLVSAFVSGSEIAYFGLKPSDIDELEESDDQKDKKVFNLISHSERLLATILISNNLVNITMVVLLTFAINQTVKFNSAVLNFLVQTVFLTFLLLLFGEIFPKLVARGRTMNWVRMAAPGVTLLYKLFGPLAKIMVRSTTIVNKIVTKKSEKISTDELEKALEISDLKEGKDKEMLEGILSFGEKQVSDIMISRIDVTAIESHDSWDEVMNVILKTGYSRIPVYDRSRDSICGVLYSKDLLPFIEKKEKDVNWQSVVRDAYFVPESRMIDDLLEDFRKRKIHIAIVIDEYGGTQGIVTLEDIIEEIVGEIDDEYDDTQSMYKRLGPDSYIFYGKTPLSDFCHVVGADEDSLKEEYDADTLAGLLLAIKEDFPSLKETVVKDNMRFQVIQIEKHRITRVKVTITPPEEKNEKED